MAYFAAKADQLYSIDIYWIVVVQGSYAKSTLWQACANCRPTSAAPCAMFRHSSPRTSNARFSMHRSSATICCLRQKVHSLIGQLSDLVEIQLLGAEEAFRTCGVSSISAPSRFYSCLHGSRYLDFQLCDSELEAHRGHLRLDDYYVQCSR